MNRCELDFINSVEQGVELIRKIGAGSPKLMPDVFHMNIEDQTIGGELEKWAFHIGYIHLADSNRLSPGKGHTDFGDIFSHARRSGYDGWFSVEILPKPDAYVAARKGFKTDHRPFYHFVSNLPGKDP